MDISKADLLTDKLEKNFTKVVEQNYRNTLTSIKDEIGQVFNKYGINGKIDMSVMSVMDRNRVTRLNKLFDTINADLSSLNRGQLQQIAGYATDVYTTNKKFVDDSISKVTGLSFDSIDRQSVYNSSVSDLSKIALKQNQQAVRTNIQKEITQSIIRGDSYRDMTKGVQKALEINANNALRIARTETARNMNQARDDSFKEASDMGINLKKQWVSTRDDRTRPSHQALNLETVGMDKTFSNGLRYPGDFNGPASEVINCRCVVRPILVDYEEEITTSKKPQLTKDSFPSFMTKDRRVLTQTQNYINYVNNLENADEDMLKIYQNMSKMKKNTTYKISYSSSGDGYIRNSLYQAEIKVPKIEGTYSSARASVVNHEFAHFIDFMYSGNNESKLYTSKSAELLKAINKNVFSKIDDVSDDIVKLFTETKERVSKSYLSKRLSFIEDAKSLKKSYIEKYGEDVIYDWKHPQFKEYQEAFKTLREENEDRIEWLVRSEYGSVSSMQDMYDALSGGKLYSSDVFAFGHGPNYFNSDSLKAVELWADYANISLTNPELIELMRKDMPDVINALDGIKLEMAKELSK